MARIMNHLRQNTSASGPNDKAPRLMNAVPFGTTLDIPVLAPYRNRALNPTAGGDGALLRAVAHGEFLINGFRNRDLRKLLCPATTDERVQRQQAAAMTRKLALLRAHGLIVKVQKTHRYRLSAAGQRITTALLAAYEADVTRLASAG